MHFPFLNQRRDPFWDIDGAAARYGRRKRRLVALIVMALSAVILALILVRVASVDAAAIITGPSRSLILASLVGDAVACCLVFARDAGRGRALRHYGERRVEAI